MDLPRPAADHGARLHQGDQRPGQRQQSEGSAEDRLDLSGQGRQGAREHPRLGREHRVRARQARAIHGLAHRLRRCQEDATGAARRRRAAEVQRKAAREDREIRRRPGRSDHRTIGRLQEGQSNPVGTGDESGSDHAR